MLVVKIDSLPDPEELAALRNHPKLRLIRLTRYRPGTPVPTAAQIATIRGDLRAEVEVR